MSLHQMSWEEFRRQANEYAADQYSLPDFVAEFYDRARHAWDDDENPEYFVEYLADKYGLVKWSDWSIGRALKMFALGRYS